MSPSRSRPEFFVDRSLGRHLVAEALRSAGWSLRTHADVFGVRDEEISDNQERIDAACGADGPFVYADHRNRIARLFPS